MLHCYILGGPGGERIKDVVTKGTELELQLRRGVGQASHTCNKLGRPHTLAIIPTSSVREFIKHKQRNTNTNELY
jgi:hypothetical protein